MADLLGGQSVHLGAGRFVQQRAPDGDRVELRVRLRDALPLLAQHPKIMIPDRLRRQHYALILQESADGSVDLVLPFVGLDIDQGAVHVEENCAHIHHTVRRIVLASSIKRRRWLSSTQLLRAIRSSVNAIWKGTRPQIERKALSRSGKWHEYSHRKCPMNGSAAFLSPVACKKACCNSPVMRPTSQTRSARAIRSRSMAMTCRSEPSRKLAGVASPWTSTC